MFEFLKRIGKKQREVFFQTGWSGDYSGTTLKVRPGDYTSMVEAYETWIYAAVSCISRSVAKCQVHLYKENDKKEKTQYTEITQHPFFDLWKTVNPQMNNYDLLEMTQIYLDLTGNAYWYIVPNNLNKPKEIYVLRANKVRIMAGKNEPIGGYQYYTPNGVVEFSPNEIIHFKYPNPHNEFYGMSPLQAMVYAVSENDMIHQFGYNILKNQAIPGNVFTAEEWVDSDTLRANKEEIKQEYEGVKRAGRTMILKGIKPNKLGLSPIEISFLESRKFLMEEILAIYGVPKTKLGYGDLVNRAVADALDTTFQKETVLPRLKRLESKINEKLLPLWDDRLSLEFENPVPADRDFELRQWETYLKNYVVSINEYRRFLGLEEAPWGGKPIAPFSMMPLAGTASSGGKQVAKNEKKTVEGAERRAKKWLAFVKIEEAIEKNYVTGLKEFFGKQKSIVIANLWKLKPSRVEDVSVDLIFPALRDEAKRMTEMSKPYFREMIEQGIHLVAEEVRGGKEKSGKDLSDDLFDIGMTQTTFDQYVDASISEWRDLFGFTINETVETELRDLLSQATDEGWNVTQLQGKIEDCYAPYIGEDPAKALRIARTETSRVMHDAELVAYKEAGFKEKTFCTALDEVVCPDCESMDGVTIPIDEEFTSGNPPIHPNSYDKETEIYTKQGIKPIKDVQVGDFCLSLNPDNFKLEYVRVVKTYKHRADKVIHFFNNQVDLMVTEDHNVFYKGKKWGFVTAKELLDVKTGQLLLEVKRNGFLRRKTVLSTVPFSDVKRWVVNYNDWTYCVDLEKYHTLLTRRNGKVVWSGNCRCNILGGEWE